MRRRRAESDPLAELARLIGQTDPFANMGRANQPPQPRPGDAIPVSSRPRRPRTIPAAGPPPWMQRAARQEAPPPQPGISEHGASAASLCAPAARPAPEPDYQPEPPYADDEQEADPARYDDALYGQLETGAQDIQREPAYPDDPYAYQDGYDDGAEEPAPKRRGGMMTVAVVLALAVIGTGAAFAYRTYVGSPRSGEPPIIKADTAPTKIVPAPADASAKMPDRLAAGDGTEKIVPREEAPVDVNANAKAGSAGGVPAAEPERQSAAGGERGAGRCRRRRNAANGTLPNTSRARSRPSRSGRPGRRAAAPRAPAPAPAAASRAPRAAAAGARSAATPSRCSSANAPLSLSPQAAQPSGRAAEPRTRVAASAGPDRAQPRQRRRRRRIPGPGLLAAQRGRRAGLVQGLAGQVPDLLGSRSPLIKRADLGDKGVYYRAMVGPFGSPEEASQFCGSLKTAGGQCVVQRN